RVSSPPLSPALRNPGRSPRRAARAEPRALPTSGDQGPAPRRVGQPGVQHRRRRPTASSPAGPVDGMRATELAGRSRSGLVALAGVALPGCRPGPDLTVAGSYFPSWMLALVLGILATIVCWQVCARIGIDPYLWPRPLVYAGLILMIPLVLWLGVCRGGADDRIRRDSRRLASCGGPCRRRTDPGGRGRDGGGCNLAMGEPPRDRRRDDPRGAQGGG